MKLISMLLSSLFFWSCNAEKRMIKYYQKNRNIIYSIKSLSNEINNEYPFQFISVRNQKNVGFELLVSIEPPYKLMTLYYNQKTFELLTDSMYISLCDSCTEKEREKYKDLLTDKRLKELLRLYMKIKPNSIRITPDGVFFALGEPLKSPNKSEVSGGIFIPFGEEFFKGQVVKQIEGENAYLYDTVVE